MTGIIAAFAKHRIAPNLLMLLMIFSGLVVINRLETRFFPKFELHLVAVSIAWNGASAEDIADAVLTPVENQLRNTPDLKKMYSVATDGVGLIYLEFPENIDENQASNDVKNYLDLAAGRLPADSEAPEVKLIEQFDNLMYISLSGDSLTTLRPLARQLENALLQLGVDVDVSGLPKETIEIRLDQRRLVELNLTPEAIGRQMVAQNVDVNAGNIEGTGADGLLLRALAKKQQLPDIADLSLIDNTGQLFRLGDIAEVVRVQNSDEPTVLVNNRPAVEFLLKHKSGSNSLDEAKQVLAWIDKTRAQLPAGFELTAHREKWRVIQSRLDLLINNGLQGLAIVLLLLFLFLNWRLAFWVAAGIPATFMVALCILYFLGGTINMLSMFAFIMTTGIVVDDAIVVGENAMYHLQRGKPPLKAAVDGAKEMFAAIFASTFTTIASFMPLLLIGGVIGSILSVFPVVVVCVLLAALFECFTVLPGHMASAFVHIRPSGQLHPVRQFLETNFERFQEGPFRRLVVLSLRYRWVTIVAAFVILALSVSLMIGGALKYRFFPDVEGDEVRVQVDFIAGTPRDVVESYMQQLTASLHKTIDAFPDDNLLRHSSLYMGQGLSEGGGGGGGSGDEKASMVVELSPSDERNVELIEVIQAWRANAPTAVGLKNLSIGSDSAGPPGEDLEVQLSAADLNKLKSASLALQAAFLDIPGVSEPQDDMPYGKKQIIFSLKPLGRLLNFSVEEVARQLRHIFDGYKVQTFYQGLDEVEVRVLLQGNDALENFASFQLQQAGGETVMLSDIVQLESRRGFDSIQRVDNRPIVKVVGEVDFAVTDVNTIVQQLESDILPNIVEQYGVSYSFEGKSADEEQTVADIKVGLLVAAVAIFIILAAAFSSWTLPLVILLTAPLGVIGAFLGHWMMGYPLSILSLFGIFALTGIVINDSIVLVRDYLARLNLADDPSLVDSDALITYSVCRRLRAIILTSLTTIGGLTPLMFEGSRQAQFLIPMAISICFGLAFATLLILFVMPAYLSVHASVGRLKHKLLSRVMLPTPSH